MNMIISNNSIMPPQFFSSQNPNLAAIAPKSSSALNAPIIKRIHNVKPGCGSCGR